MRSPAFYCLLFMGLGFSGLVFSALWPAQPVMADETHDIYQKTGSIGLPTVQTLEIQSPHLQQTREVIVSLPTPYGETGDRQKYPVIFVMDAELMFGAVAGLVHYQGMNSQMPEAIVVGIPNAAGTRRDMTPTPLNADGKPLWFGGQQDSYLNFIRDDVIPMVESRFHAAGYRVLVGLSPSGQFALHTLWKAPDLFDAHIALNTADFVAAGYDGSSVFDKTIAMLKQNPQHKGHLYISMPKSGGGSNPRILAGYAKFDAALRETGAEQFRYRQELVDHSGYASVLPAALSALTFIFPAEQWDPSYRDFLSEEPGQTLRNIKEHYARLSEAYGFEAFPKGERYYNRNRLKRIGYLLLAQERTDEAIRIFDYWLSLYPRAANAYDSLADAYGKKGDAARETALRERARAVARENADFRQALY